jgi:hypothetical protein
MASFVYTRTPLKHKTLYSNLLNAGDDMSSGDNSIGCFTAWYRDNSFKPPHTWTKAIMFGYVLKGLGRSGQRPPPLLSELVR